MKESAEWLLIGKEEIRTHLKNATDYKLKKWVDSGMPVRIEGGEWTAHKGNLEEWFKAYTRHRATANEAST